MRCFITYIQSKNRQFCARPCKYNFCSSFDGCVPVRIVLRVLKCFSFIKNRLLRPSRSLSGRHSELCCSSDLRSFSVHALFSLLYEMIPLLVELSVFNVIGSISKSVGRRIHYRLQLAVYAQQKTFKMFTNAQMMV